MSPRRRILLLMAFCAVGSPGLSRASESTVVERLALIIGSNQPGPGRFPLRYATSDARALSKVLAQLGGLRAEDELLLLDPDRDAVLRGLDQLGARAAARRGSAHRLEAVVYYSGHSDEDGLLLGTTRVSYAELRERLLRVDADVSIVILDSCASGAFTRHKGGRSRPPFLVDDSIRVRGHAYLASSSDREAAQESDRIGGSFFTHYLITGLRGAADVSGDHRVTLNEAYNFAFNETLAGTEKTLGGAQHAAYDIQLVGTGDVVMTDLHQNTAVLTLPRDSSGRFYVRDGAGVLAAELNKQAGRMVELGLDPGHYRVIVDRDGKLFAGEVTLTAARPTPLDETALTPVARESTVLRGSERYTSVPVNLSVIPALSINERITNDRTSNMLSLSLITGRTNRLRGVAFASILNDIVDDAQGALLAVIANTDRGPLSGVALAGGFNQLGGDTSGVVAAIGANDVHGPFQGLALAAGLNRLADDTQGVVAASFANVVQAPLYGIEFAAGWNGAAEVHGLQMGVVNTTSDVHGMQLGLVNVAQRVHGFQLGLVNVAEDVEGGSVGIVSVIKNGTHDAEVWTSDLASANVALKLGGRIYGIAGVGAGSTNSSRWLHIFGAGVHIAKRPTWDVDFDLIQSGVHGAAEGDYTDEVIELRPTLAWHLFPKMSLFAAPSLHVEITDADGGSGTSALSSLEQVWHSGSTAVRLGPGFSVGLRLF